MWLLGEGGGGGGVSNIKTACWEMILQLLHSLQHVELKFDIGNKVKKLLHKTINSAGDGTLL